jgi:hypothetical protein
MAVMKRRAFLQSSLLASGSLLLSRSGLAEVVPDASGRAVPVSLSIDASALGHTIPSDFTGLSYEQEQLRNPNFFAGTNKQLVGYVRTLGRRGVLRLGGNTSEYVYWDPKARPTKADLELTVGPSAGPQIDKHIVVTPEAIRNLRDFLDETGWSVIYGLNLSRGTPENAAEEAAFVMKTIGRDKLVAFQLSNEPDLFAQNGLRSKTYNVDDYMKEWEPFFRAVRARVPDAPFAGPDTAGKAGWLVPFGRKYRHDLEFVSSHYYAEGPPSDPAMTLARLMHPNPHLGAEIAAVRQETGLRFRLTETNSCWGIGKRGVSNVLGGALWAGDLMFQEAAWGSIGINFHSGGYAWYTPIAGTQEAGFVARPEYYAMLMFAQAGTGRMVSAKLTGTEAAPLLTAYAVRGEDGRLRVALFNKNLDKDVVVSISGSGGAGATVMWLEAPLADDATDVTFAGSVVGNDGRWLPMVEDHVPGRNGLYRLHMRKATAALVTFA